MNKWVDEVPAGAIYYSQNSLIDNLHPYNCQDEKNERSLSCHLVNSLLH
jgi:hypothetical protein